jgi:DNA repair exonuclease SbcCD nuclease subunit
MSALVHIGDFHAAPGPRNADRYRALDTIIAAGLALPDLGAWLWPGDLNHGRMTIEDRNTLADRLQRMAAVAPVLIVYGNHDLPGDLDVFARLKGPHPIYVVDRPCCLRVRLASFEFATVFCVPYPTKAGLAALGVAKGDVGQVAGQILQDIFQQAAGEIEAAAATGDLTLMIGHVNVAGAMTSVGQPNIGREIEIGAAHLDRLGQIPKLLNHVHKAQEIAGAHYAGSVTPQDWGEIEVKRFIVVEMTNPAMTYRIVSHPIEVAPLYHVEGHLTRESFTWAVTRGPGGAVDQAPATWRGAEVRVRYTFPHAEKNLLLHAQVQATFAEAARLELEPRAVADRMAREPAIVHARTLADKVAAMHHVEQLADGVAAKLAHLEHGDPAQLLSDLQRTLVALEAGEDVMVCA